MVYSKYAEGLSVGHSQTPFHKPITCTHTQTHEHVHIQICKCQWEVNVDVRLPNLFMDTHGKVAFQLSFKPDVDNENDKAGGGEGISYGQLDFKNAFNWHRATRHWHVSRG